MAKPGKKKRSCEKYKNENHLDKNKQLKEERNERRIERFRKRREEKLQNPVVKSGPGSAPNEGSNQARHTEFSRMRSIFDKLDREVAKEKLLERRERDKKEDTEDSYF